MARLQLFRGFCGLGRERHDLHDLTGATHPRQNNVAMLEREEGMVLAHADIGARVNLGAALADDDVAGDDELTAELLYAEAAAFRAAPGARPAAGVLTC